MAFKKTPSVLSVPESPADLFRTLTRRMFPDLMPHQRDILRDYENSMVGESDIAIQLPTGSGKTLVGLLIAEWRRRKFNERVIYLCPTKQLVNQTVEQAQEKYGIHVNSFIGSKHNYLPSDKADYTTGMKIAVTTYSSLFNVSPFFQNPDVVIIDDVHASQNYISKMWSLKIPSDDPNFIQLYNTIITFLRPYFSDQSYAILTNNNTTHNDVNWVDKLPSMYLKKIAPQLISIIDTHLATSTDLHFSWKPLRNHLEACHVYVSPQEILIRPLIPPTWTHQPFSNAKQRLYMSATLGAGGDLERLTGITSIIRLPAPEGFRSTIVGRRFFIFPDLSLEPEDCKNLRLRMQEIAGRSIVLTTNHATAKKITEQVKRLDNFTTYDARDIETIKTNFIENKKAAVIMAARFDGIDFPDDECRLLCLDGLPKVTNAQERFLMTKMGIMILFNERLQTRVLQAIGRCTRGLQDRSAVFVTGDGLCQFLADDRNWKHFHPELQAEFAFGVEQSKQVEIHDFIDNFRIFLNNDSEWDQVNDQIFESIKNYIQEPYPSLDNLNEVVKHEVRYQKALWQGNKEEAYQEARRIISKLTDEKLRGYRALWHYLACAAAWSISTHENDSYRSIFRRHLNEVNRAATHLGWLTKIIEDEGIEVNVGIEISDQDVNSQIVNLETELLKMGITSDQKFEQKTQRILEDLKNVTKFEEAQRELGQILGFEVGKVETDASPDPWWLGETKGIVFEDHVAANQETKINATKARQAASHVDWMKENVLPAHSLDIHVILVTPCTEGHEGAKPSLNNVLYWSLTDFHKWAQNAIDTIRELKGTLHSEGDMFWRQRTAKRLTEKQLTLNAIIKNCPVASEHIKFY